MALINLLSSSNVNYFYFKNFRFFSNFVAKKDSRILGFKGSSACLLRILLVPLASFQLLLYLS
ncbi:MAG: hypothetical protein AB1478_11800, partial [Nitrospirota bacterium]